MLIFAQLELKDLMFVDIDTDYINSTILMHHSLKLKLRHEALNHLEVHDS